MRKLTLITMICMLAACGGNNPGPSVGGGNNGANNGDEDMGGSNNGANNGVNNGANNGSNNGVNNGSNNGTNNGSNNGSNNGAVDMGMDMPVEEDMGVDMAMEEDMGVDMNNTACPPRNGAIQDPCACDAQCASGACVGETMTSAGFCSVPCGSRSDCNGGAGACKDDPQTGLSYCWPDDTGNDCGTNNVADASKCTHDMCFRAGPNHSPEKFLCTLGCDTAADCGTGHACAPVRCRNEVSGLSCVSRVFIARSSTPQDLLAFYPRDENVCVRIGEVVQADCNASATNELVCPSAICDAQATPANRCTAECIDVADCPAGGCDERPGITDPVTGTPIKFCNFP